jgi:hypothetical protein
MVYDMGLPDDPDPEKRIARGVIENAIGQVDPEFFFQARRVETIGDDRVILHHAQVTTCTQPVPYWSFHVSKAKIRIDGYAHLFNLRPAIGKVPFFYLPYLLWPVKRDRAPGLLFPEFGTTTSRGRLVSIPVFVPLGPSADVTFMPQYYTIAGWGLGAKIRAVPNRDGYAEATGQYIWDRVEGRGRYRALFKQTQTFLNGFRMVSDVDIVSDFDYFTDYVRNLTYSSSPTSLGRMSFTRSGKWTSLLVKEEYREQLFANVAKAGQLMPGLEIDIFDEQFKRLPHDGETVGEILIRGPWICSEYYKDPQPGKFHDGWLITGDVGKIDPEEYLIISDRSKDLVKSGGEWISSVDLENHIVGLSGVAQACVVGRPHPKWDERPIALVVMKPGSNVEAKQVIAHCATQFAKWQLPDDVLFVETIPLTSTGKMDKKTVRAHLDSRGYELPDLRGKAS